MSLASTFLLGQKLYIATRVIRDRESGIEYNDPEPALRTQWRSLSNEQRAAWAELAIKAKELLA